MKKIENECCGCSVPAYPCMGDSCPNRHVLHYFCDKCKQEFEPEALFVNEDDEELCIECFLLNYETVAQRDRYEYIQV